MLHKPALVADKAEGKALHSTYQQRALLQTKSKAIFHFSGMAEEKKSCISWIPSQVVWNSWEPSFVAKSCLFTLKSFEKYVDRKADWWNCILSEGAWFTNLLTINHLYIQHVTASTSRLWCRPLKVARYPSSCWDLSLHLVSSFV